MAGTTVTSLIGALLTLDDGGLWTAGQVTVGAISGGVPAPGTLSLAASPDNHPTTLEVGGGIELGEDGSAAGTFAAGTLDVRGGSEVSAASLEIEAESTLYVGVQSGIVLGTGSFQPAGLMVGSDAAVTGISGLLIANVTLDGRLAVVPPAVGGSDPGGPLYLDGPLSGSGTITVGASLDLMVANAVAFTGTVALGTGATLSLMMGDAPDARLAMAGAAVDLRGVPWGNGQTLAYDSATGLLTISAPDSTTDLGAATLDVGAGFVAGDFAVSEDAAGGLAPGTLLSMPEAVRAVVTVGGTTTGGGSATTGSSGTTSGGGATISGSGSTTEGGGGKTSGGSGATTGSGSTTTGGSGTTRGGGATTGGGGSTTGAGSSTGVGTSTGTTGGTLPSTVGITPSGTGGNTVSALPCFVAGTAILTPRGPVSVERLAIGDIVVTRARAARLTAPIRWIGRRYVDLRRHPEPEAVQPVRIQQGAVAPGVPARDLLLSPDHAVFLGGVLIPVKYLLNGRTVVQDRHRAAVLYLHIELDRHDVVLAEALPAETYLDTGNRAAFGNAAGPVMLHPDFAPRAWERDACAHLTGGGEVVAAIRMHLAARAALFSRPGGRAPCARGVPAPRSRGSRSGAPPAA
jgi:collagen type I/II/III/V/XI/XXIV/XXVII alpha